MEDAYVRGVYANSWRSECRQGQVDPTIRGHVERWGKDGDAGVMALDGDGGVIGAAWVRPGSPDASEYKLGDERVPELAMAVLPHVRRNGVGESLLRALLKRCSGKYPAVVLSVRESSPALGLYRKVGFRVVGERTNRVGGNSLVMQIELAR